MTGLEFRQKCLQPSTQSLSSAVYLWHGWLSGCQAASQLLNLTTIAFADSVPPALATNLNGLVVEIDWGTSNTSCCNYLQLSYCYLDDMADWMAEQMINCATNGVAAGIENTILVGHSMGAQYSGYTGQKVMELSGKKLFKIITLDAAGPFYADDSVSGRCQGMEPDIAEQTIAIYTSPGVVGTDKMDTAQTNIQCNANENFCQEGTNCQPILCHSYAINPIFDLMVHQAPLQAIYLNSSCQLMRRVSFYNRMEVGTFNMEAADNRALLNPDEYLN